LYYYLIYNKIVTKADRVRY